MPEYSGYNKREPYPSELEYFKGNKNVGGMATKDKKIIINPFSNLSPQEQESVAQNEGIRLWLEDNNISFDFELTGSQKAQFKGTAYQNNPAALKKSIIARILSGDPSASATQEQMNVAQQIKNKISNNHRPDGNLKGEGWLGELNSISGKDMTEVSIGVNINGKEILIPTLVPSLTQEEVEYLLTEPQEIPKIIVDKAVKHALPLLQQGISPFKRQGFDK